MRFRSFTCRICDISAWSVQTFTHQVSRGKSFNTYSFRVVVDRHAHEVESSTSKSEAKRVQQEFLVAFNAAAKGVLPEKSETEAQQGCISEDDD